MYGNLDKSTLQMSYISFYLSLVSNHPWTEAWLHPSPSFYILLHPSPSFSILLHCCLSSTFLVKCVTVSPVHAVMSNHVIFGLHRAQEPDVTPCIISFPRQSRSILRIYLSYVSFFCFINLNKFLSMSADFSAHSCVFLAVRGT